MGKHYNCDYCNRTGRTLEKQSCLKKSLFKIVIDDFEYIIFLRINKFDVWNMSVTEIKAVLILFSQEVNILHCKLYTNIVYKQPRSQGVAYFFYVHGRKYLWWSEVSFNGRKYHKKKLSRTLTLIHPHPRPVENDHL